MYLFRAQVTVGQDISSSGLNPYCSGCIFLGKTWKVSSTKQEIVLILIVVDVSF